MIRKLFSALAAIAACVLPCPTAQAQASVERHLPVDGHIAQNGQTLELNWFTANPPRVGAITVRRRPYGQTGGSSWKTISPRLGPVMRFQDTAVRPGKTYEYQVLRSARDIVDAGYWIAGVDLPAAETSGTVHLVVDQSVAHRMAPRLNRFARDLTGDGWTVRRRDVPRWDGTISLDTAKAAQDIRSWLREAHISDPFGQHAVILIGHVPVVFSGRANPDGHAAEPHPTDLFYADMNGLWRVGPDGVFRHNHVPDSTIEMQIGRIDFAPIAGTDHDEEIRLLQAYLDKNHHWRMGLLGDLREAYGASSALIGEHYGLHNIVGSGAFTQGGHHDVGEQKPWLWGVDFGDYDGSGYAQKYAIKAVFTLNFGSGKQKFDRPFNPMTAILAQPWYPLTSGWGGRPSWWLHPMALGGSIGEAHRRTVNNGTASAPYRDSMDYYPTGQYLFRNPVWVNLLGDPTLKAFPLAPPSAVRAQQSTDGIVVSWEASPDPDVLGYKLYRAQDGSNDFAPLAEGDVLGQRHFTDTTAQGPFRYMVRAYGKKDVYAGSFHKLSQGAFAKTNLEPPSLKTLEIRTPRATPVALPDVFHHTRDGEIHAVIEGPDIGTLRHDGMHWTYIPPAGFQGVVDLRYSVSGPFQTRERPLSITVDHETP